MEATDDKQAKAEDKHKGEEISEKVMETYSQTETRLTSYETHVEPKMKKRRGGNNSIEFV